MQRSHCVCRPLTLALGALVAVPLVVAVAQAQGEKKPAQDPSKVTEAAVTKPSTKAPMSVPLSGITADNSKKIATAIQGISRAAYTCEACKTTCEDKITCTKCNTEYVPAASAVKVLHEVTADTSSSTLRLTVTPGMTLRLSELERAIKAENAQVNTRQLYLGSQAKLFIEASGDPKETQAKVEKALSDSKLFASSKVRYHESKKQFVAMVGTSAVATHADASAAVEKAGFKLVDVAWTAPCGDCAKAGNVQAACAACWPKSAY